MFCLRKYWKALTVIKSTDSSRILLDRYLGKNITPKNIIFFSEFLREGKALHDKLHPSRIIVRGSNLIEHKSLQKLYRMGVFIPFSLECRFFLLFCEKSDIYGFFLGIFAIFYWFLSLAI